MPYHTHAMSDVLGLLEPQGSTTPNPTPNPFGNMKWQGTWIPGTEYRQHDVVFDTGWTMIANKDTTARPAPQPSGLPSYGYATDPTWVTQQVTDVVYSGNLYTFTASGYVREIRVWVPELLAETNYRFVLVRNPNSSAPVTSVIEEPVLNENAWTTLALGSTLVFAGEELLFFIDALNSGSSTPTIGGWTYDGADNNLPPATQAWNHNTQESLLRIDTTDLDSSNRQTELLGITTGSTIQFSDSLEPGIFKTYRTTADPVLNGTAVEYAVNLINSNGSLSPANATDMQADTPIAQPTKYVEVNTHWSGNSPSWATVAGFLRIGGVEQPGVDDNGYGVDLQFEEASVSEDWDVVSLP